MFFSTHKDLQPHTYIVVDVTIETKMLIEVLQQTKYEYYMAQHQDKCQDFKTTTTNVNTQFTNE